MRCGKEGKKTEEERHRKCIVVSRSVQQRTRPRAGWGGKFQLRPSLLSENQFSVGKEAFFPSLLLGILACLKLSFLPFSVQVHGL